MTREEDLTRATFEWRQELYRLETSQVQAITPAKARVISINEILNFLQRNQ